MEKTQLEAGKGFSDDDGGSIDLCAGAIALTIGDGVGRNHICTHWVVGDGWR